MYMLSNCLVALYVRDMEMVYGKTTRMVYRNCHLKVMCVWLNQIQVCGRGDEYIVAHR